MRGGGCFGGRRLKQQDRQVIRIKCNNGNETLMETNDDDDGLLNKIPRDIQSTSLSSFPHTCPTAFLSLYSSDN